MGSHQAISRRGFLGALAFAAAGAQEQEPKFSTGVKVVNLFATVRDKKGQIVRDLNKDDFVLDCFAKLVGVDVTAKHFETGGLVFFE